MFGFKHKDSEKIMLTNKHIEFGLTHVETEIHIPVNCLVFIYDDLSLQVSQHCKHGVSFCRLNRLSSSRRYIIQNVRRVKGQAFLCHKRPVKLYFRLHIYAQSDMDDGAMKPLAIRVDASAQDVCIHAVRK